MTDLVEETSQPGIIYQDDFLLVLNKPPFWIVNRSRTTRGKETIQDWLEKNFNFETVRKGDLRAGIAHRLDKDTSGILLVGKKIKALEKIQKQFLNHKVSKEYFALVHEVLPPEGRIKAPISRLPWDREKFGVGLGGKEALTKFTREAVYWQGSESYSLVRALPKTGRTHQIRVHFRYLGYPIVSDPNYVGRKRFRQDQSWCPRIFLHASTASFVHPGTEERVKFSTPLPKDLKLALKKLEKKA
jgi:23S rRNA pseudouridine1911/1915/1917 synthase